MLSACPEPTNSPVPMVPPRAMSWTCRVLSPRWVFWYRSSSRSASTMACSAPPLSSGAASTSPWGAEGLILSSLMVLFVLAGDALEELQEGPRLSYKSHSSYRRVALSVASPHCDQTKRAGWLQFRAKNATDKLGWTGVSGEGRGTVMPPSKAW